MIIKLKKEVEGLSKQAVVLLSMVLGLIISFIGSISIHFVSSIFAGGVMGFSTAKWLYITLAFPIVMGFVLLSVYFYNCPNLSNKQMWKITLLSVFAISLFSGTIGTIVSDSIIYGSEGVNYKGRIIWGILYSILSLPITMFIGKLLIDILAQFVATLKKKGVTTTKRV